MQHDYVLSNASGGVFRADTNNVLLAIVSNNAGTSAPSTTYAYMWWADTTTNKLKQRNAANSAWIEILPDITATYGGLATASHKTQHQSGGSDAIKLDDLAAPDDNTDLNATTSAHGLLKKLSNVSTEFLNGQGNWATPAGGSASGIPGLSPDGVVKYVSVTSVDIDANFCWVYDGTNYKLLTAINLTVAITTSGANGLDTGSEGSSRFYFVYVIHNGTTTAGLLSESATAPTVPSGYDYKALVGFIYNDGSSNFRRTWINDRIATFERVTVLSNTAVSSAGTLQSLSISSAVPSIAKHVFGTAGVTNNAAGTLQGILVAGDANRVGQHVSRSYNYNNNLLDGIDKGAGFGPVPLITAQTIYWTAYDTGANSRIDITGCTF